MSHDHDHSHHISASADRRYLIGALILLGAFMIGEVIVAVITGSIALLSDAGHMLSDVGAIAAALWAMHLAALPARGRWTFGWKRAEILSALANGITLVVVAAVIAVEAVRRLFEPPAVPGLALLIVASIGIVINLLATALLAKADRGSLNIEGAYQHILTDLFGFIATLIAGIVILTTGWSQADPIASLIVVALMLRAGLTLLRESGLVLLEAAPSGVDLVDLRDHLTAVDHVVDVHDLHVWTVTSDLPAVSAHIVAEDSCFHDGHIPELLDSVQSCLVGHFDVSHSTFQFEPAGHQRHEPGMH